MLIFHGEFNRKKTEVVTYGTLDTLFPKNGFSRLDASCAQCSQAFGDTREGGKKRPVLGKLQIYFSLLIFRVELHLERQLPMPPEPPPQRGLIWSAVANEARHHYWVVSSTGKKCRHTTAPPAPPILSL